VRAVSSARPPRRRRGRRACRVQVQIPVCVFVFDLLAVDGEDLLAAPLRARRARLPAALPAMRAGYLEAARCWELPAPPAPPAPPARRAPGEAGARGEAAASPAAPAAPVRAPPATAEGAAPRRRTRAGAAGAAASGAAAGAAPAAGARRDADARAAPAGAAAAEAVADVAEAAEGEAAAGGEGAEGAAGAEAGREARVRELLQEALAAGTEARPSRGCSVTLYLSNQECRLRLQACVDADGVTQWGPHEVLPVILLLMCV